MADKLANKAADIAKLCKRRLSEEIHYNLFWNPINVDISKDLIWLRKKHKQNRIDEWKLRHNEWLNGSMDTDTYMGERLMHNLFVEDNGNKICNNNNKMKEEFKFLNPYEASVICKLRTEHINLNDYKFFRFKDDSSNFGNCRYCNVKESVSHFLIDCPGQNNQIALRMNPFDVNYNGIRNILKSRLKKIDAFFKNNSHFTAKNILFPHCWQQSIARDDLQRKSKMGRQISRRVNILREVINFVKSSRRFKREKYGI